MKLKHLLAVALMAIGGSAWAQIVSGTDYLIQNVETGYYFAGGRDYGTHGTLLAKPQFFTFTTNGSGYSLDSHQYNNATSHFLGTNLYVDGGATAWNVVETSTPGVYTIENGGNYLAGNGFNANIKTVTDANDAAAQWKLISKADLVAMQESATIASPLDVTAFIKAPEFKRNSNASQYPTWTVTGADGTGTPSNYAFGGGDKVANCGESYHANNGFDFSQTISGLKAGTYRFDGKGFYRKDSGSEEPKPYMYVDEEKSYLPLKTGAEGSMADAYASFLRGSYAIEPIYFHVENNGSVKIGVHGDTNAGLWNIWGELGLTYYGDVTVAEVLLASYVAEYNAAMTAANGLNTSVLSSADQAALATIISNNTVVLATATEDQLTTATANLNSAVATYGYKIRVAELAAQGNNTDFTSLLVNPSFEEGNTSGWTNNSANGMWTVMTRANAADPKVGNYWLEKYGVAGKIDLKQTVKGLPQGHYRVSVLALDQASLAKLVANTAETPIVGGDKATYTVDIMLDDNSDLTLGLYCESHTKDKWVGFDNFQLTYVSSEFPALPAAVEGKMNATIAQAQTDAIAAYTANKTVANYNAAAAAIAAAQASKTQYEAADAALTAQKAIIDGTNVYASGWQTYVDNYNTKKAAYDDNTLDEAVVNPTAATAWHASTAYNALLTLWKLGESACNNFDNALYINTWSTEGNTDGSNFTTPFFEYWVADGQNLAANTISATIDVENGLYEVEALVRASHNSNEFKAVNLTVNGGTEVNVADGTQIGTTNRYMDTFQAQGLVKDGKLVIAFDVPAESSISWLCFKNVKYTKVRDLTPAEAMVPATPAEIAEFKAAIEAAEAKTVGFKAGNYSPYVNAEAIKALADAKEIDTENPVDIEVINAAIAAIADANWTVNAEEVNAINNGDFEGTYSEVSGAGVKSDRAIYLPSGWSFRKNGIDTNDITILKSGDKADNNFTAMTDLDGGETQTFKYRGKWGNTTNLDFYQRITLPAGTYYLECDAWKSGLGGDGKIYVGASNEASLDGNETSWRKLYLAFTLDTEKTVEVGFNIKHNSDGSEKLIGFDNFVLKSLDEVSIAVNAEAKYGTFVAPFEVAVPANVTAYTVDGVDANGVLTMTEVAATIPANTPVVLNAEAGLAATTVYGKANAIMNPTAGLLTGVYAAAPAPVGSYVLQKHDDKVGFYHVEDVQPTVGANRAYLTAPSLANARAFFFDAETAISAIEALTSGKAEIYNLNGVKLNSLQKGINIVNGKKIMVK